MRIPIFPSNQNHIRVLCKFFEKVCFLLFNPHYDALYWLSTKDWIFLSDEI